MRALILIIALVGAISSPLVSATWQSHFTEPITLSGDGVTEIELRPELDFTIDYDIDPEELIDADDNIHFRLYRTAASSDEISGEVVITHVGVIWQRDKLGALIS